MAWWAFESPIPHPGYDRESSALFEAGLLAEAEMDGLLMHWRQEFDRASASDFFHCAGSEILRGAAAFLEHCKWADIPRALVKAWSAERRRSAERICKLQVEASGACREGGPEPGA